MPSQFLLRSVRPDPHSALLNWVFGDTCISWRAAAAGAFVGTYSHVLLDSIMHSDMRPLAPWSQHNSLLLVVPIGTLHVVCTVSGVLGALLIVFLYLAGRAREWRQR